MQDLAAVARIDEMGDGEMRAVEAGGRRVVLARAAGRIYAVDDVCTHRGCSLSEGDLEGTTILCPCHGGAFDVATGAVVAGPPPAPVPTYPVHVEDGEIRIDVR